MFKKLAWIMVILIVMPLIIAAFISNTHHLERSVVINKPKGEVFNYIKHLKNHQNFTKWASMNPYAPRVYKGIDGEVGFVFSWHNKQKTLTKGEKELIAIDEGNRLDFELRLIEPTQSVALSFMTTESLGENKTKVSWGTENTIKYPKNILFLLIDLDETRGEDIQTGLNNLKAILEEKTN